MQINPKPVCYVKEEGNHFISSVNSYLGILKHASTVKQAGKILNADCIIVG